ncbi:hypothetical protein ECC18A13_p10840 (plasmid) [Enterobacter sp. 18A13]|nr:hypothetical protein ECC18A13_p10840 [Enterobacter sp. 18A13]
MKYVFIGKHQPDFSIKAMCRVLRVAGSGWYAWRLRRHQITPRQQFRLVCDYALTQHFCYPTLTVSSPKLLLWLCDK